MKYVNKLVRDNIPDIIESEGNQCITSTVEGFSYKEALKDKLCEETMEFLQANNVEELADILEVLDAFIAYNGWTHEEIQKFKAEKREKKGGFEKGIILEKIK